MKKLKKLLSILLTASMVGAPVASNCFACRWIGNEIEMTNKEGYITEKFKDIMDYTFDLDNLKKIDEKKKKESLEKPKESLKDSLTKRRLIELVNLFNRINATDELEKVTEEILYFTTILLENKEDFEIFKKEYNTRCVKLYDDLIKEEILKENTKEYKNFMKIKNEIEASSAPSTPATAVTNATKKEEIKEIPQSTVAPQVEKKIMKESQTAEAIKEAKKLDEVVRETQDKIKIEAKKEEIKEIPQSAAAPQVEEKTMKEIQTEEAKEEAKKLDEVIGNNQDKVEIKVDEKETKKKGSLMVKVILGGTLVAIVSYTVFIIYYMYINNISFKDANQILWNFVSGSASQCYGYIKDAISNLFSYAKGCFAKSPGAPFPSTEDFVNYGKCPAPTAKDIEAHSATQAKSGVFGKVFAATGAFLGSKALRFGALVFTGVGIVAASLSAVI